MHAEGDGQCLDESRLAERAAAGHLGLRAPGELLMDDGGSLARRHATLWAERRLRPAGLPDRPMG